VTNRHDPNDLRPPETDVERFVYKMMADRGWPDELCLEAVRGCREAKKER